jgi:hypothetical protein
MSNCQLAVSLMLSYDYERLGSLQGKFIMSVTYGYDLKDGDKILEAAVQTAALLSPLLLPGATPVNDFPFCAITSFIHAILPASHSYFQCGTFLHGSHTSATNH